MVNNESKTKQYPEEYTISSVIHFAIKDLESFEDYYKRMEDFMIEEFDKYNQYLDDKFFEHYNRFNGMIDLSFNLQYKYPDLFRKTLFINIFSYFENILNDICVFYEEMNNEKFSFLDMKGKGIYRAKEYIAKVVGVNFNLINIEWSTLTSLQKVRNQIVHNYSKFELDKSKEWEKREEEFDGLNIIKYSRFHEIRIDKSFVENSIKVVKDFLNKLLKQLPEKNIRQ
jgi:hypothetical protein